MSTAHAHKICPGCEREFTDGSAGASCPSCSTKLVELEPRADDVIGTVIDGRFEIRDELGHGGMGTVYRAWQRSVGREVAVKLMDPAYSRDPMSVRRFLREARLASQLSQPNTVSVFDFGQAEDGRLFIAMELIRGRTLHQVVTAEGAFSVERAVRIGIQICDALDAAHAAGIIHRDLKLENVLVLDDPPGRDLLKVLDFGLAKNIREPATNATESGVVVGTPRYLAPETATTGESTPAGDLYALGVVLGELVLAQPLWEGENLAHLVTQKLDTHQLVRKLPPALAEVIGALIDPTPERRPTATRARAMLDAAVDATTAETPLAPSSSTPASSATIQLRTPRAPVAPVATPVATPVTAPVAAPTPRPRRSIGKVALGGVLVATAAIVVALVLPRDHHDTPVPAVAPRDAAAPAVVVATDATVAAPVSVTLFVVREPASVKVFHGDEPVADLLSVPRGTAPVELRAEAPGYITQSISVVPDASKKITIKLVRAPARVGADEKTPF